jgi:hypothetical protein
MATTNNYGTYYRNSSNNSNSNYDKNGSFVSNSNNSSSSYGSDGNSSSNASDFFAGLTSSSPARNISLAFAATVCIVVPVLLYCIIWSNSKPNISCGVSF